jgi:hypothetical protein
MSLAVRVGIGPIGQSPGRGSRTSVNGGQADAEWFVKMTGPVKPWLKKPTEHRGNNSLEKTVKSHLQQIFTTKKRAQKLLQTAQAR